MVQRNEKRREEIAEYLKKGLTLWEISKLTGMQPQLIHYYKQKIKDESLTK